MSEFEIWLVQKGNDLAPLMVRYLTMSGKGAHIGSLGRGAEG